MKSNSNARPVASGSGLSYTQKISLAAGSLSALYLLPAQASIIHVSGSPVSLLFNSAIGTTVNWDVDGVNGPEFQLVKGLFGDSTLYLNSATYSSAPLNGRGWVAPFAGANWDVQALQKSFTVGPTLAAYAWGTSYTNDRWAMYGSITSGTYTIADSFYDNGFQPGDNYAGFRFLSGADTLYGWALINFDLTPGSAGVTIKEWAYNDTADTPIHIADTTSVPEPSTPALTLLGLGAAGLRAWRARKKARAEDALAA